MVFSTRAEVDVELRRYDDLLAAAARPRPIRTATRPARTAAPRMVGRIHAGLCRAAASLLALASIG